MTSQQRAAELLRLAQAEVRAAQVEHSRARQRLEQLLVEPVSSRRQELSVQSSVQSSASTASFALRPTHRLRIHLETCADQRADNSQAGYDKARDTLFTAIESHCSSRRLAVTCEVNLVQLLGGQPSPLPASPAESSPARSTTTLSRRGRDVDVARFPIRPVRASSGNSAASRQVGTLREALDNDQRAGAFPRLGSFEVSCALYDGALLVHESSLFSRLATGEWPRIPTLLDALDEALRQGLQSIETKASGASLFSPPPRPDARQLKRQGGPLTGAEVRGSLCSLPSLPTDLTLPSLSCARAATSSARPATGAG